MYRLVPLILLLLAGCRSEPTPKPPENVLDPLLRKINNRLALMEAVALNKQFKNQPTADPEREAAMLKSLAEKAEGYSLKADEVRWFFVAQVDAAKQVQDYHRASWKKEKRPAPEIVPELAEIRQKIDRLNLELLDSLAKYRKNPADLETVRRRAAVLLTASGITDESRKLAIAPLLSVP